MRRKSERCEHFAQDHNHQEKAHLKVRPLKAYVSILV
jgi:hypothetical protein